MLFFVIVLFGGIYYLKLSFSEGKIIPPKSVESFLLVPDLLKDKELTSIGIVENYYYDSEDGPKPLIIGVKILTIEEEEVIKNHIREYFLRNGFKEDGKQELKKGQQKIFVVVERTGKDGWLVDIDLSEYFSGVTEF
ncbi:MAG: hypothetical protein L3J59_03455 [Methylococcaceae bacterium]|nr:hypothetical protein [Methylococcaceae bacterium]